MTYHRHEEHVRNNVIESERDEGKDGEPYPDDFGREVTALHTEEASKTHEPVAADATKENLVPLRGNLLVGGEGYDFGFVRVCCEDAAI